MLNKFTEIFEGHGKIKDDQASLGINKTVSPVYQKTCLQPYHIQKAIDGELSRL